MRLPKIRAARERTGSMIATIMNFPMRRGTTILKVLFSSLKKKTPTPGIEPGTSRGWGAYSSTELEARISIRSIGLLMHTTKC